MTNEIKEMNFSEMLFNRDERLLDYITNLQEENERLKQYKEDNFLYDFEELQDKVINLQKENIELNRMCEIYSKSLYNADLTKAEKRIDKAIEYINYVGWTTQVEEEHLYTCELDFRNKILNILRGDE